MGILTPGDLNFDLSQKMTKWFRNDFSRAFERCLSFFSTATRSRDHGGRSNDPPPPAGGGKSRGPAGRGFSVPEIQASKKRHHGRPATQGLVQGIRLRRQVGSLADHICIICYGGGGRSDILKSLFFSCISLDDMFDKALQPLIGTSFSPIMTFGCLYWHFSHPYYSHYYGLAAARKTPEDSVWCDLSHYLLGPPASVGLNCRVTGRPYLHYLLRGGGGGALIF